MINRIEVAARARASAPAPWAAAPISAKALPTSSQMRFLFQAPTAIDSPPKPIQVAVAAPNAALWVKAITATM